MREEEEVEKREKGEKTRTPACLRMKGGKRAIATGRTLRPMCRSKAFGSIQNLDDRPPQFPPMIFVISLISFLFGEEFLEFSSLIESLTVPQNTHPLPPNLLGRMVWTLPEQSHNSLDPNKRTAKRITSNRSSKTARRTLY